MKPNPTLRRTTLMVQVITCLCLLALTPMASAERYTTFYHTDHLGNVIGTSDDDGVYTPIVGSDYESYGDSDGYSRPAANNPAYTGKKFDRHTGLYYYGGRYYDPQAKRFISPDPMAYSPGNPMSFNRYAYGNNNPLRYIDPDGANAVTAFGGLIYESAQFVSGHGFNGSSVLGALADGYNGEGSGLARAAIDDALTFFPLGAVAGAAVKYGRMVKAARVAKKTVGRHMSPDELAKMKKTGRVQEGGGGQTRVADPANPNAYRNAPKGDVYAEFDVPANRVLPQSKGTGRIPGPNSPDARVPGRNPSDYEMPHATNIRTP